MKKDNDLVDESNVWMIGHLTIRDPDTGEIILKQREKEQKKEKDDN